MSAVLLSVGGACTPAYRRGWLRKRLRGGAHRPGVLREGSGWAGMAAAGVVMVKRTPPSTSLLITLACLLGSLARQ